MFQMTVTLTTPDIADDEDLVYDMALDSKKEVRKVERALMRGLVHLGNLSDDALDKKGGVFEGKDPTEMQLVYLVTEGGKKWTKTTCEWPNQTDVARAYLVGLLDQLMKEAGHGDKRAKRAKGKRG